MNLSLCIKTAAASYERPRFFIQRMKHKRMGVKTTLEKRKGRVKKRDLSKIAS